MLTLRSMEITKPQSHVPTKCQARLQTCGVGGWISRLGANPTTHSRLGSFGFPSVVDSSGLYPAMTGGTCSGPTQS